MSSCEPSTTPIDTKSKLGVVWYSDAQIRESPPPVIVSFSVTTLFHGLPSVRPLSLVLVQKLSIVGLPMWFPRHVGYATFFQHQRTKHVELDIHLVREKVESGQVRVLHVPSRYQITYIFTKGIPLILFTDFRDSLIIRPPPATTAGVY
ncbi:hypothetical protein LIER_36912 [Lithospermum erythrorhizon]|uniref:Uncharacterized protein n=1 Tax=Lithospermum erythrorhizon TaxID=34254 RepID=A0AAV3PC84_LITER